MIIRKGTARRDAATAEQIAHLGSFTAELLSETGGLTQFGAFVETLPPGSASSDRHWHEGEDEFLLVLSGTPTVIEEDGPHDLAPGDAACWPAGVANGHHVLNRSDADCTYLVVGTRAPREVATYSDVDMMVELKDGKATFTHKDGTAWEGPR